MAAPCSPPHLGAHPKTPKPHGTAAKPTWSPPRTHLTLHGRARNPHGAHREPTGNRAGTCMAEREEPTRSPREPTGKPLQTVSKTAQEPTSHLLVFIILFIRGKGDAVGNIETLASQKKTAVPLRELATRRRHFRLRAEHKSEIEPGHLLACWSFSREEFIRTRALPSPSLRPPNRHNAQNCVLD